MLLLRDQTSISFFLLCFKMYDKTKDKNSILYPYIYFPNLKYLIVISLISDLNIEILEISKTYYNIMFLEPLEKNVYLLRIGREKWLN